MKILKIVNREKVDVSELSDWQVRRAARGVVINNNGQVGLLHVQKLGYYKLPGGGIEHGESEKQAFVRECREELGAKVEIEQEIGQVIEYRQRFLLQQISFCYLAKVVGETFAPEYTEEELSEDFTIVWVSPQKALQLVSLGETSDYEGQYIEERDTCVLRTVFSE